MIQTCEGILSAPLEQALQKIVVCFYISYQKQAIVVKVFFFSLGVARVLYKESVGWAGRLRPPIAERLL